MNKVETIVRKYIIHHDLFKIMADILSPYQVEPTAWLCSLF